MDDTLRAQRDFALGQLEELTRRGRQLSEAPVRRRFEFVHDAQLRPVLEQAFVDSGRALEDGDFQLAFMMSCGVLEAIITDALEHCGSRIAQCGFDSSIQSSVSDPQSQSA